MKYIIVEIVIAVAFIALVIIPHIVTYRAYKRIFKAHPQLKNWIFELWDKRPLAEPYIEKVMRQQSDIYIATRDFEDNKHLYTKERLQKEENALEAMRQELEEMEQEKSANPAYTRCKQIVEDFFNYIKENNLRDICPEFFTRETSTQIGMQDICRVMLKKERRAAK